MNCETCKTRHDKEVSVPFAAHDKDMARLSASNKHLFIAFICTIVFFCILFAGAAYAIVTLNNARIQALNDKIETLNELRELENEIETVYEYEIEQDSGDGGMNNIVGRDFFYGQTESENQENDTP